MFVCMYGTPEMLKYLETYLIDIKSIKNFKDEQNTDSYLAASSNGNLEVMKYLEKEHNWSPFVKNNFKETAYDIAIKNNFKKIENHMSKITF